MAYRRGRRRYGRRRRSRGRRRYGRRRGQRRYVVIGRRM